MVKVQAGYKVQPLSAYLKQPAPPAAPAIDFPKINKEMVKTNFFEYLDFALAVRPGRTGGKGNPREAGPHRHRRQEFDFKDLSPEQKAAVGLGMKDGEAKVEQYLAADRRTSTAGRSARSLATAPSSMATG